jgi:hypothetical protein
LRRSDFEHVIAAAADHLGENEFVVIGSQSIHASPVEPPADLLESMEVDLYPRGEPERALEVEVVMGDGSYFHSTFGYYAHAVGPETAKAPAGWESRLIPVIVPPRKGSNRAPIAYCLEPHDLVLAKLARVTSATGRTPRLPCVPGWSTLPSFSPGLTRRPFPIRVARTFARACA